LAKVCGYEEPLEMFPESSSRVTGGGFVEPLLQAVIAAARSASPSTPRTSVRPTGRGIGRGYGAFGRGTATPCSTSPFASRRMAAASAAARVANLPTYTW